MNSQKIVEEIRAKRELEDKIIKESEEVSGINEFFVLKENLDRTKEVVKFLESEVSTKLDTFETLLSKDVYKYLFGTSKTSVRNTSNGIIKKDARNTSNGFIKRKVALRVLNGEKISNIASDIYPDRPLKSIKAHNGHKGSDGRNYLVFRQIQEAEKSGWIKIIEKATSNDNYSTIEIEKLKDF